MSVKILTLPGLEDAPRTEKRRGRARASEDEKEREAKTIRQDNGIKAEVKGERQKNKRHWTRIYADKDR